jgi:hypothetical protein
MAASRPRSISKFSARGSLGLKGEEEARRLWLDILLMIANAAPPADAAKWAGTGPRPQ